MPCKFCGSEDRKKFNAKIAIYFPRLKNIDKPTILVFPRLELCFDCGTAEFTLSEDELRSLEKGKAAASVDLRPVRLYTGRPPILN
jgi:hypothetical protein